MRIFITVILIFLIISCDNSLKLRIKDDYHPNKSTAQLLERLHKAYSLNNADSLKIFFTEWNRSIKPNSNEFINQSTIIQSVYSIYKLFYKPTNPSDLGKWEKFHLHAIDSSFLIIQNNIIYILLNNQEFNTLDKWDILKRLNKKNLKVYLINHFRPPLKIDKKEVLYLEEEYDESLNQFLSTNSGEQESQKKRCFFKPYADLLPGHWGKYWHIDTHPSVEFILFNDSITKARILFRYGYQGGETTLVKANSDWKITASKSTWIE